MIGLSGTE
jgi:hypothetical protein